MQAELRDALENLYPDSTVGTQPRRQTDIDVARGGTVAVHVLLNTNWFSYELMAERHGLKPWSAAHWAMLRRYAALMARTRQNVFWIPQGTVFSVRNGVPELDRARLARIVRTFTEAGLYDIEGGHFGGRSTGEWQCPTFSVSLTKDLATSAATAFPPATRMWSIRARTGPGRACAWKRSG